MIMRQLVIIVMLLTSNLLFSQNDTLRLNNINVELLGSGIGYSINFERLIPVKDEFKFVASIGYENLERNIFLGSVSFIYGRRHGIEGGYGLMQYKDYMYKSIRLGYRYQKNHFLFKACFTPILNFKLFGKVGVLPWGGLTFGYCF